MGGVDSSRQGITAVLLAGGQSTRMGADKAFIDLQGVPAWQVQLDKLRALCPAVKEILISARSGQRFPVDVPARVVVDEIEDAGPMGGLITSLRHARNARVLVLGIDLLRMPSEFLQGLCDRAFLDSGLICRQGTRFETLAALYPRSLLPLAEECLRRNHLSLQELVSLAVSDGAMQAMALPIGAGEFFANVNTTGDLAALHSAAPDPSIPAPTLSDSGTAAVATRVLRCEQSAPDGATRIVEADDHVAAEAPLEIRVEGTSVAVVMRTPGHDEELVLGFLISEGVLSRPEDVFQVTHCDAMKGGQSGNVIDVLLRHPDAAQLQKLTRHVFSSSSCGICGKATLDSILVQFPKNPQMVTVAAETVFRLPAALRDAQETFSSTGGLHASGVFDRLGNLLLVREDVGRHNALDKVLGAAFCDRLLPLNDHILLVSGRISFELMQKSLAAGIPVVAGISAPSSLAIDFARESGQTLCGFLRDGRMNIYAHAERILP